MSLFSNRIIGLEVGRNGVGGALLRSDNGLPQLEQTAFVPLPPDLLRISRREPNLLEPDVFVQQVRAVRESLQTGESRVALSLPDGAGRIALLELDETWKNRSEAAEIILWKLKKSLPHEPGDLHLDFQILLQREEGPSLIMVALVARQIVEQYENLLYEAGLQPACINLNQVNLVHAFAADTGDEGITAFVSWYGESLGIVVAHDGVPLFWRSKYLPAERGGGERIDQELHGSLEAYHKQYPGQRCSKVFYCAPGGHRQALCGLLTSLWEQVPLVLEADSLYRQRVGAPYQNVPFESMSAAIAAAAGRV